MGPSPVRGQAGPGEGDLRATPAGGGASCDLTLCPVSRSVSSEPEVVGSAPANDHLVHLCFIDVETEA